MEKKKRHYSLDLVKKLVNVGKWKISYTALRNAQFDFDFVPSNIQRVVLNLQSKDFYKSMTSYHDHTLWQDVYCPKINGITAYIKLSIEHDMSVVVQFKRK